MVLSPFSNIKDIYSQVCNLLHVTRWTFISETNRNIFSVFHCKSVKIVAKKAECMLVNMTILIPRQREIQFKWEVHSGLRDE